MQRHDTQPCGHPVCFTDQRTQSLLSSPVPVTQTGCTTPYTHMRARTHTHTPTSHTLTHSSHTPQTHTLLTPSLTHSIYTHTHSFTYTHPHTFLTYSQTYYSYPYKHTPSHTPYLHTHTHTHTHTYRAYRSTDTGNTGTQQECSHTKHMEYVVTAQSPS